MFWGYNKNKNNYKYSMSPLSEKGRHNNENWEFEKILKASYHKSSLVYKVKYRNQENKCKSVWIYSGDLPENTRKAFHTKYTSQEKPVNGRTW